MKFSRWLRPWSWRSDRSESELDGALVRLLGKCRFCEGDLAGHDEFLIGAAMTSVENSRYEELSLYVKGGDWQAASRIREIAAEQDFIEFRALRCPVSGRVAVKRIASYAALEANDGLVDECELSDSLAAHFGEFVAGRWRRLRSAA